MKKTWNCSYMPMDGINDSGKPFTITIYEHTYVNDDIYSNDVDISLTKEEAKQLCEFIIRNL